MLQTTTAIPTREINPPWAPSRQYGEGWQAQHEGLESWQCPYMRRTPQGRDWVTGWFDALEYPNV